LEIRYGIGFWLFGQLQDRFTVYHDARSMEEKFERASKVEGAEGLEVIYPAEFDDENIDEFKSLLKKHGFKVSGMIVDLFTKRKWINGSLSSKDEGIRREAVELSKKALDAAKEVGCETVTLWLGHDGYDYPFQADYLKAWNNLSESIKEIASHRDDVKVSLEYKLKEPRTHIFIGTVGKALMLAEEVGLKNVGVTMDFGHALYAFENPSESIVLLHRKNKLFHIHFNDNYRDWDHDLIVSSINLWENLEFFYWLRKINYHGWISLDIYPYREDPIKMCQRSIENLKILDKLIDKIGMKNLEEAMNTGDSTTITATLMEILK